LKSAGLKSRKERRRELREWEEKLRRRDDQAEDSLHSSWQEERRKREERAKPKFLTMSPLAYIKLKFFLHRGDTEVGGFGISGTNPLYIVDFVTVEQDTTVSTVHFRDASVADYFDNCVDEGLKPNQFGRIWIHTHPMESPNPSGTDEVTFDAAFGKCDWSIMFIMGITGRTYARLNVSVEGGGIQTQELLQVAVDWRSLPTLIEEIGEEKMAALFTSWGAEYNRNVHPECRTAYVGYYNFNDDEGWEQWDAQRENNHGQSLVQGVQQRSGFTDSALNTVTGFTDQRAVEAAAEHAVVQVTEVALEELSPEAQIFLSDIGWNAQTLNRYINKGISPKLTGSSELAMIEYYIDEYKDVLMAQLAKATGNDVQLNIGDPMAGY